jgi:hypothetical protein
MRLCQVAPAIKNAVKKTLHGVFTGLPRLVQKVPLHRTAAIAIAVHLQLSREAHGAAKVFRGEP